jgi:hypothetical protein
MSGEIETSQAEVDSKALEGFLVGNQDLERLETLLDHFNIFEALGWYWGWSRGRGTPRNTGSSKDRARGRALPAAGNVE